MLALLLGCSNEAVSVDEVTNQWWHFDGQDLDIYLEQRDDGASGDVWYDWDGPDEPLETNDWGGSWEMVGDRRFRVDYEGSTYTLRAVPSGDEPGCYDVSFGLVLRDLACPVEPL